MVEFTITFPKLIFKREGKTGVTMSISHLSWNLIKLNTNFVYQNDLICYISQLGILVENQGHKVNLIEVEARIFAYEETVLFIFRI